jgi:hypothetical protein
MKISTIILLAISSTVLAGPSRLTQRATTQQIIQPSSDTTKCLFASDNDDGAAVLIEECSTNVTSQLWSISGSSITIFGDKSLDNTNGDETDGNKLQIYTCYSGNKNQQWTVSGSTVQPVNTDFCMDNTGGVTTNGNSVSVLTLVFSLISL